MSALRSFNLRVNNLGKLGIGFLFLGTIILSLFIYNALVIPTPDVFIAITGLSIDYFSKILIFSCATMMILNGITFYFASKTRSSKIEQ